jgi:hypothetical protein
VVGEPEPVEHEIDSVELAIKPGIPFAVVTRMASTTIKIRGVLLRKQDNTLFVHDFFCSREITPASGAGSSIMSFGTDCALKLGKSETVSGLTSVRPDWDGRQFQTRNTWTLELTDAAAAKAAQKPAQPSHDSPNSAYGPSHSGHAPCPAPELESGQAVRPTENAHK